MESHSQQSGTSKLMITISQMSGVYNTSRGQLIFNKQNKNKKSYASNVEQTPRNRTLEKMLSKSTTHDGDADSLTVPPILSMTYIPKTDG